MLHYKEYAAYEDYLKDQTAKCKQKESYIRQKSERKYWEFCANFAKFEVPKGSSVLCLGARFGDEVRAWRTLGCESVGVDLFGDEKDLVIKADWNNLPFDSDSFDYVYTNSIDHANDLDRMVREIKRVLNVGGKVLLELMRRHASSDEKIKQKFDNPERYEAMLWNIDEDVLSAFEGFIVTKKWVDRRTEPFNCYLLERIC